ncbi:MAG: DUF433 domain-containing protein [Chloroflexi bacterium]|nr:DUF433 domain-containing protein [Chloroflexota bacterium]
MTTQLKDELGNFQGLYAPREAAQYLTATLRRDTTNFPHDPSSLKAFERVKSRQLIHWVRVGLTLPGLAAMPGDQLVIAFEDLISMRVITILRVLGVKWPKIHRAEIWLREQNHHPRPFAVETVWTETKDVFAELPFGLMAAASRQGQLAFVELLGNYLQPVSDMTFIRHDGYKVAATWRPHADVLIDPQVQFGEPCITETRLPTRMVWRMANGGDTPEYLAQSFKLSEQQILHALEWEDRLRATETDSLSN